MRFGFSPKQTEWSAAELAACQRADPWSWVSPGAISEGQYEEALEYYQRCLRIDEKAHGEDHISSAGTIGSIATGTCTR
jgi:hypothetical protein